MSYQALYREWRPQTFEEVVGQTHVVETLRNALKKDRIAHAYLFAGPRGTGKTTVAKLLAKAVNCTSPGVEPCNECSPCETITRGSSMDVMEIDAASNRGIDEIRELRDKARYAPGECAYKVYIIDEVHMLTAQAFNALLKTLEEPPAHVLFVLATTEPHKLPLTILSRCQRFDFHLLSVEQIVSRLRQVCRSLEIAAKDKALNLIGRHAEGALRDGLSLLDQSLTFVDDELTEEEVLVVLGTAEEEVMFQLTDAVRRGKMDRILTVLDEVATSGKDLSQFTKDYLEHLRNLLLVAVSEGPVESIRATQEGLRRIEEQSRHFTPEALMDLVDEIDELNSSLRWTNRPRLTIEVGFVRAARRLQESELVSGERAASEVEASTSGSGGAEQETSTKREMETPSPETTSTSVSEVEQQQAATAPEDEAPGREETGFKAEWEQVMKRIKRENKPVAALLAPATAELAQQEELVLLRFESKYRFHCENSRQHSDFIADMVEQVTGREVTVKCISETESHEGADGSESPSADEDGDDASSARRRQRAKRSQTTANEEEGEEVNDPLVQKALEMFDGQVVEVREGVLDPPEDDQQR